MHNMQTVTAPQGPKDYAYLLRRYSQAKDRRGAWEQTWQECYDYALPQRGEFTTTLQPGKIRTDRLYDGTALDAVDQLAASLLGHLTPPWTQWFGFKPGPDLSPEEAQALAPVLEESAGSFRRISTVPISAWKCTNAFSTSSLEARRRFTLKRRSPARFRRSNFPPSP